MRKYVPKMAVAAAALAAVLACSGCGTTQREPKARPASYEFIVRNRTAFENGIKSGDLAAADAALSRLERRKVSVTEQRNQLGLAQRIDGLLERGNRQLREGDWPGMAATRGELEKARLEVYRGEFPWPPEYLDRLESGYADFMKKAEAADESIGKNWQ